MSKLAELLNRPERKAQVVQDCLSIIEAEVSDKEGWSGVAIKAGYKAIKGITPGFVEKVVHDLLPEFADAVDPIYQEAVQQDRPVKQHFVEHSDRVADNLLSITDGRAKRSRNSLIKKTYDKLRGQAKKNVQAAVPRLGDLIAKHTA